MSPVRVPLATYRLQFHPGFRFCDAAELVPYLQALGISDLYASPLFRARSGSPHGYDVTDPTQLNPELGTEAEFMALSRALKQRQMGLVLDVVPNHMAISDVSNQWWQDVLESGPSSPYARYFDIDWNPPKTDLINKVLLPILSDQYGKVLERGDIQLAFDRGGFFVTYHTQRFWVALRSWTLILEAVSERLRAASPSDKAVLIELESLMSALHHLPLQAETDPECVRERQREKEVLKRRLEALAQASETFNRELSRVIADFNGTPGAPRTFDRLERLLAQQAYRLCDWRVAADEVNYRRFFDVNELAAIRIEDPVVFEAVHALILRLVREAHVTGLRIDHPDGLYDPEQYLQDLQAAAAAAAGSQPPLKEPACYVVVEKILAYRERLPARWLAHGTTGYEALNLVNGLFVHPEGARQAYAGYARLTEETQPFEELAYASKKLILGVLMSSELHVLARRLDRLSEQHRWSRDFTLASLQEALREVIACFPVYRTYIRCGQEAVGESDERAIRLAIRLAKRRNPGMSESLFDFIASVLLLEDPEGLTPSDRRERREFVLRFQQITAPVMAKGLEDTAFYRFYPLASLNEVGGDPSRLGVPLAEFHQAMAERLGSWPDGLSATSTHDTKRSEDVRARLNVLSELGEEWLSAVARWQAHNHSHKSEVDGEKVPDSNEEYLFYQTLVGLWPLEPLDESSAADLAERLGQYLHKAIKEAKIHTSWVSPNQAYEQALQQFIRAALALRPDNAFLADFRRFHERLAWAGAVNALAQVLLKITLPGVPDFYQGGELWDFSLVDPDNRRPVDFKKRMRYLEALVSASGPGASAPTDELIAHWQDGRIKLYTIWRALELRKRQAALFQRGVYIPCEVWGEHKPHVVAFARREGSLWTLTVLPRWIVRLGQGVPPWHAACWSDHLLILPKEAPAKWRNVLTQQSFSILTGATWNSLPLQRLFQRFPIALLESTSP